MVFAWQKFSNSPAYEREKVGEINTLVCPHIAGIPLRASHPALVHGQG